MARSSRLASQVLLHVLLVLLLCTTGGAQQYEQTLSPEQWREDLAFMARELERLHLDLFHDMSPTLFESSVRELHARIPDLEPHQIIVEMARITALIGDGHSGIRLASDPKIGFRSYPIRFYLYEDGLFVQRIARDHARLVGARVVRVGNGAPEQAYNALRVLVPRDNEQYARLYVPFFMTSPEILEAVGLIEDMEAATFVLEIDGGRHELTLAPAGLLSLKGEVLTESGMSEVQWVDATDDSRPLPLWLSRPRENKFWFEYLEQERTVFAQINEIQDKESETLSAFSARLFSFIEQHDVERLVYDLRWNRGGNAMLVRPLVRGVIRTRHLDAPGHFFVVIGRQTFSAAQSLVNELEKYTRVLFVGEPTASRVNFFADNRKIFLPNSGLNVRASYLMLQAMHPLDNRRWTEPHIPAMLSSRQYRDNIDPAMKAILEYQF